ncbi:MAG: cold shock domain-containing protein [Bdellovibrionales bacterium]
MSSLDFPGTGEGEQIEAVVKWFNLSKGFGFVAPADGSPDAFMHVSTLTRAGLTQIAEGTKLSIMIGDGPKGRQVLEIRAVLGYGELPVEAQSSNPRASAPVGPIEVMQGVVKWFKPEKGFGFIAPEGDDKDVFVHKTVIAKLGLVTLEPGQRVEMEVHLSGKGREAVSVKLL